MWKYIFYMNINLKGVLDTKDILKLFSHLHNILTRFVSIVKQNLNVHVWKSCQTECDKGTYGLGCIHNCSSHCLNDVTCNKTTGICDHGCEVGYSGMLCETGLKFKHLFIC